MALRKRYRTVWRYDVHLGSRDCHIDMVLEFPDSVDCETLFLVGDIVDVESMRRRFFWPESHTEALVRILAFAERGTRIVYIPGNHDAMIRALIGVPVGPVEIAREAVHETADGRRLLVLHGDRFDAVLRAGRLARLVGCAGIVCGHIHKADLAEVDGLLYCNDGDWVESCTALLETRDGRLELGRTAGHSPADVRDADVAAIRDAA